MLIIFMIKAELTNSLKIPLINSQTFPLYSFDISFYSRNTSLTSNRSFLVRPDAHLRTIFYLKGHSFLLSIYFLWIFMIDAHFFPLHF